MEAELLEQHPVERCELGSIVSPLGHSLRHLVRQPIEIVLGASEIEVGVVEGGDEEGTLKQIDRLGRGFLRERLDCPLRLHLRHQLADALRLPVEGIGPGGKRRVATAPLGDERRDKIGRRCAGRAEIMDEASHPGELFCRRPRLR